MVLCGCTQASLQVPELKGRVNDYANVLSQEEQNLLEKKLESFEKQTTNQVVILTIPSLEGKVLESFSMEVCEKWKLGRKDQDNGCLLLFVINDRESRIEVGYGLEPILTDGICGRILRNDIAPSFKEEKYFEGLDKAVSNIISYQGNPEELQKILEQEEKEQIAIIAFIILAIIGSIVGFMFGFGKLRGSLVSGGIAALACPIIWANIFGGTNSLLLSLIMIGAVGGFLCYWIIYMLLMSAGSSGSSGGSSSSGSYSGGGGGFGGGGASGGW